MLKLIKRHLVKTIFKRVRFQYNCRPSKVTKRYTKNVILNCTFSRNLNGFQSIGNIIAQNISETVLLIIFSFRLRIQNFSVTNHCLCIFNNIFKYGSLYSKYYNKIFGYYFKKTMKVVFLISFKTIYEMILQLF